MVQRSSRGLSNAPVAPAISGLYPVHASPYPCPSASTGRWHGIAHVVRPRASPLGCLQDAPPYARDAGPLIAVALEEFEAVELTFGHAVVGL
jgi:hypothetical protein